MKNWWHTKSRTFIPEYSIYISPYGCLSVGIISCRNFQERGEREKRFCKYYFVHRQNYPIMLSFLYHHFYNEHVQFENILTTLSVARTWCRRASTRLWRSRRDLSWCIPQRRIDTCRSGRGRHCGGCLLRLELKGGNICCHSYVSSHFSGSQNLSIMHWAQT